MENSTHILRELEAPALEPYLVHDRAEVAGVLSDIRQRKVRMTVAYGPTDDESFPTMLLAVDPVRGSFVFDVANEPRINQRIASASGLGWVGWLDGIKIEFASGAARTIQFEGGAAFASGLPDRLLRVQRRNAFRVTAPATRPLMCQLDPTQTGKYGLPLRVVDISALGLCLLVSIDELPWNPGVRVERARLDMPEVGTIVTDFEVRYVIPAGARHPAHFRRCGVQFLGLSPRDSQLVQRYVNDLQRERAKAKLV